MILNWADMLDPNRQHALESDRQAVLSRAAQSKRSNSWIFRDYQRHITHGIVSDWCNDRDGVPLKKRAWLAWLFRTALLELSLARMKSSADRRAIERRNIAVYGSAVPTIEEVCATAASPGIALEDIYTYVVKWGTRSDMFECFSRRGIYETSLAVRRRRPAPTIDSKVLTEKLRSKVSWSSTGDVFTPWRASHRGDDWIVRVNEYPDDHLCTLIIDGENVGDFDDWPRSWPR